MPTIKNINRSLRFHRDTQMTSESIPRTTRDNSQSRIRMHQRTGNLIDGTISTNRYYYIHFLLNSISRNLSGMPCIFRLDNRIIID